LKNLLIILFITTFLLCSCEENISYLGKFDKQYSLNCILRNDKDIQFATIKSSYPPNEENPVTDVRDAIIRLILPDTTLFFKDSVLSETPQNIQSLNSFYYLEDFHLVKGMKIKIEASLPDGTVLSSETIAPRYQTITLPMDGGGPTKIPAESPASVYYYKWNIYGSFTKVLFGPSFYISYSIAGNEELIKYKEVKGRQIYDINNYEIFVESIDETMRNISKEVEDKSQIIIHGAVFEVKVFDPALGIYVNSIRTFEDEFSVRLSEPNISNIEGGLGIFGTYFSEKFDIDIDPDYIESFGYNHIP